MAANPRRIVGSMVEAKACHVTSLAECARRYGSNSKTKKVQGIVTHVEVIKNSTTNRTTTFVTAAYDLGGTTIRPCRLNIRSVKAVPTPTAATVPTGGGALLGSADGDSTTTEVSTQPTSTIPTLAAPSNTNTSLEQPTVVVARATPPLTTENNETVIANNDTPLPEAAATVHEQEWFVDDPATKLPVNGNYHSRNWAVKTRMGDMLGRGGDHQNSYSRLEYFLMLFPPQQLQLILQLTNNELAMARKNYTTAGEIVKFFGVMLLVTRFEFGSQDGSDSNDESPVMTRTGRVRAGVSCHLTPTKRRRRTRDGVLTAQRLQGRCIECGKKTTYLCSACMDKDDESKTPWLCHTEKRPACFANHYKHTHLETYD